MITKAEAKQIRDLLHDAAKMGGMNYSNAVRRAIETLEKATEGRHLPKQLEIARRSEVLPMCAHRCPLMDWSGEQLVPPCGCRLVEPTHAAAPIPKNKSRSPRG